MFKAIKSNWFIMLIILVVGVYFKDTIINQLAKVSPSLASKLQAPTGTPVIPRPTSPTTQTTTN